MDIFIQNFYHNKIEADTFFKILSIVSFFVITLDFIWIQLVMKNAYKNMISDIQKTSMMIRLLPTILSYITIILPIVLFVIPKITPERRVFDSLVYGGLMGFFMYGMFSFTNYALIKDWSMSVVLLDTAWGTFLYFIVSLLTSYLLF
jgi:uncharacterized membrane protein